MVVAAARGSRRGLDRPRPRPTAAAKAAADSTPATSLLASTTCPPPLSLRARGAVSFAWTRRPFRSPIVRSDGVRPTGARPFSGASRPAGQGSTSYEHMFVMLHTVGLGAGRHTPTVGSPQRRRAGPAQVAQHGPRTQRRPHDLKESDHPVVPKKQERGMAEAEREKALDAALGQIEKQFGKGSVMRMGDNLGDEHRVHPHRCALLGPGAGHRRPAPGSHRGDLRSRVVGEVDAGHARGGRGAAQRRHLRLHRRRARHGPGLRPGHRGQRRRPPHLAAGHRRAGARDRRHADPLRRARRPRHRLGGGPDAAGRDRGGDGRHPRRPPGAAHVPGAAQADGHAVEVQHHRHLHQPAAGKDRRHVRLLPLRRPGRPGRRQHGEDREDRQPAPPRRGAVLRPTRRAPSCPSGS